MTQKQLRRAARRIAEAALGAVDPSQALRRGVQRRGTQLTVGARRHQLADYDRVVVIGAGKAAASMAKEMELLLGPLLWGGLIIVNRGAALPLDQIAVREAGHPVPDHDGVKAAGELLQLARSCTARDLVICLLSGGASSLLSLPAGRLTLDEVQRTTSLLLGCGAAIGEINTVRKHLSAITGGRLAQAVDPATLITLAISDVIGDRADVIGSGPTVPDSTSYSDALAVLSRHGLEPQLPPAVIDHLREGRRGLLPETPKPADLLFADARRRPQYEIIANNRDALNAAVTEAKHLRFHPWLLTDALSGEAKEIALVYAAIGREIVAHGQPVRPPACVIAGGEPTVTLTTDQAGHAPTAGYGGRNQEFALSAAMAIDGIERLLLLSLGSDGCDGVAPPGRHEAAGAFADGTTVARGRALGLEPERALIRHDAYPFFDRLGDLLITGPTRTNVMDLHLLLVT